MAVSITQRPADWSPVNNPVVYKFATTGGPFTNYRIEVEVFAGGVSVGAIFSFTPNSSNVTTADISAILKSILYREWSTDVSEDGIGSSEFYIKYQELYTGSATSQTSDSGNTKVGVLGAKQIIGSADFSEYVIGDPGSKFLTNLTVMKYWTGYPFSVSLLKESGSINWILQAYDSDGDPTVGNGGFLTGDKGLNRFILDPSFLSSESTRIDLSIVSSISMGDPSEWDDLVQPFDSKTGGAFTKNNMDVSPTAYGAEYDMPIPVPIGSGPPIDSSMIVDVTDITSGLVQVTFNISNSSSGNIIWSASVDISSNGSASHDLIWQSINPDEEMDKITVSLRKTGVSAFLTDVIIYPSLSPLWNLALSETKQIQIQSACKNPIYLFWKNSLGGDSFWLFDWTQEITHNYADGKKCKRMVLYADGLSFSDFEAIDELNTPGNIVDVPIIELTTDVDKTSKKTDQQVYVVQPDGSKVGVVVITNPARTQTKRRQHFIEIEIEFPETFL